MDTRIVVAVLLVLGGATMAVVGAMPQGFVTPSELVASGATGHAVGVKATIASFSDAGGGPFSITDGTTEVSVEWSRPYPDRFETGRTVVVHGTVVADETAGLRILADRIEVGCPSKYGVA